MGIDSPPLEEFKRLMESLGSESMFDDESIFDERAAKAGMSLYDEIYSNQQADETEM